MSTVQSDGFVRVFCLADVAEALYASSEILFGEAYGDSSSSAGACACRIAGRLANNWLIEIASYCDFPVEDTSTRKGLPKIMESFRAALRDDNSDLLDFHVINHDIPGFLKSTAEGFAKRAEQLTAIKAAAMIDSAARLQRTAEMTEVVLSELEEDPDPVVIAQRLVSASQRKASELEKTNECLRQRLEQCEDTERDLRIRLDTASKEKVVAERANSKKRSWWSRK